MVLNYSSKAAHACVACHNRKVGILPSQYGAKLKDMQIRCVIDDESPSCRACRDAKVDCVGRSRKKRKCNAAPSTAPSLRRTSNSPPGASAPQPTNFTTSILIPVDQSTTNTAFTYTAVANGPVDQHEGPQTAASLRWTQPRPEASFNWGASLSTPAGTSSYELDHPFNNVSTESQIPSQSFSIPPRSVRQRLTNCFLEYCNPWLPIVEHDDLANLAKIEQQPVPMLLAQALWFAASCIDQSSTAPRQFYQQAKALFWSGSESDPFVAVKAALMLMSYDCRGSRHNNFDNSEFWLHVAVASAYRAKLHRDPPQDSKRGIRRRLWWTIVAQDSLMALSYARPRAVNRMDSDVQALSDLDFVDTSADPTAFSLYVDISKILGDLMECYRRGFMRYTHKSSIEDSLHLWRFRLCHYEIVDPDASQTTDHSLTVRQLKLPYLTALVLFSRSQHTFTTLNHSSKSSSRISGVDSIAASLSAEIFENILQHDEIQHLGPVFTIYAYSACMALLRLWVYPALWEAIQPDLQTLRGVLSRLARHDHGLADAVKALDNSLERIKATPQFPPEQLPSVSDQAHTHKFLETMSPSDCRLWSRLSGLLDDWGSVGAESTRNSLASRETMAEVRTVSQPERTGRLIDDLAPTYEFGYRELEDWILHNG
ncbi:hypothetical protein LTS17_009420 [Exophiala oligosperma]